MPYEPITNFRDSNQVDLGKKLVTKDYLLSVYGSILESIGNSGLTVSPGLWTWGENAYSRLGANNSIDRSTPVTTFSGGNNWKQVACAQEHTAAIKTDGTLWVWGPADNANLGHNTTADRLTPVTTFAGGTNWKQVDCGGFYTAAIKTDGTLWTWGRNDNGQLGINNTINRSTPVTTFAGRTNWKFVYSGRYHCCAIKTDGTLWLWGNNADGNLGDNTITQRNTPVTTFAGGTNWKQVSAGDNSTYGTKSDGTLWTWGKNDVGQIGDNTTTSRRTPVTTFSGGTNWKLSAGGYGHITAIKTDGTLWSWGFNSSGQLGINNTINRSTPVTTFAGGINWKSISNGGGHTIAIKTDGTLWTWGKNDVGQLGDNTTRNRSTPVTTFAGGNDWKSSAGGYVHTGAIESVDYI